MPFRVQQSRRDGCSPSTTGRRPRPYERIGPSGPAVGVAEPEWSMPIIERMRFWGKENRVGSMRLGVALGVGPNQTIDRTDEPSRPLDTRFATNRLACCQAGGGCVTVRRRLWASVCHALCVAFWLELDNPFWAGTSAAIVCQPQLGASLRKGWYRLIGTSTRDHFGALSR
jgi:hypothetical protein